MIDINIGQFLFLNKYNSGVCNIKSVPHSYIFQMYIDSETRQFKTLPILASDFSSWFAAYLQNWQNLTLLYLFVCFFTFIANLEIAKRWLFCSQNVNEREGWLQARAHAADRGRCQNNDTENNHTENHSTENNGTGIILKTMVQKKQYWKQSHNLLKLFIFFLTRATRVVCARTISQRQSFS